MYVESLAWLNDSMMRLTSIVEGLLFLLLGADYTLLEQRSEAAMLMGDNAAAADAIKVSSETISPT